MTRPPRPPGLQAIFDELAAAPPAASLAALNRQFANRVAAYNTSPQAELGGLSPDQMQQILRGDWDTIGALRVNPGLTLDRLRDVPFVADARTLLQYVAEHAPVPLTPRGNLKRTAVADLVPSLLMDSDLDAADADDERPAMPPIVIRNEGDAFWLVVLRTVLQFGKLLATRKGVILSIRGKLLLQENSAGALYSQLFRTFFREFDLRYFGFDDRHPGLQATLAWTLYQLGQMPEGWASVELLADRAWLADTKEPMTARDQEFGDMRQHVFEARVLRPLCLFGVLERRRVRAEVWYRDSMEYRRTPLFGTVLRFEFTGTPPRR